MYAAISNSVCIHGASLADLLAYLTAHVMGYRDFWPGLDMLPLPGLQHFNSWERQHHWPLQHFWDLQWICPA